MPHGVVFDKVKRKFYSAWCIYFSDLKAILDHHRTTTKESKIKQLTDNKGLVFGSNQELVPANCSS